MSRKLLGYPLHSMCLNAYYTGFSITFQTYKDFFDSILKEIHNFGPEDKHPAPDLDGNKVQFINKFYFWHWQMQCKEIACKNAI